LLTLTADVLFGQQRREVTVWLVEFQSSACWVLGLASSPRGGKIRLGYGDYLREKVREIRGWFSRLWGRSSIG